MENLAAMTTQDLSQKFSAICKKQQELDQETDIYISTALNKYIEQTGEHSIEWNWEEDDAPACIYTDYGDGYADCYISKIVFNDSLDITDIELYSYCSQDTIEHAKRRYMLDYKQDLLGAIIALLDD